MKTGLIAVVLVVVVALMLGAYQSRSEHQCFYLDRALDAKICYVREASSSNAAQMKRVYERFVQAIEEGDTALSEVVSFDDALRAAYGDRAFGEIRTAYAWAKRESLRFIVEDEDGGAILLERTPEDLYALYFDSSTSRIFFSFDTQKKYLPIDSGWINLNYDSRLEIASHYPWQEDVGGECVFRKGRVFLSTPAMGEQDGVPFCDYGPYRLLKLGNRNRAVRRPDEERPEAQGVLDDTMQFMRWIAN